MSNHAHRRIPRTMPEDIKYYDWLSIIRSMQRQAAKNIGLKIIEVKIIVDESDKPVFWTKPKVTRIEPRKRAQTIIELLTQPTEVT